MPRIAASAAALALLAASCATASMPLPDELSAAERLAVAGRQGWRAGHNLRFGDYAVSELRRSLTRGTGGEIGPVVAERDRQTYDFRLLHAGEELWRVACRVEDRTLSVQLSASSHFGAAGSTLDCTGSETAAGEWRLRLETSRTGRVLGGLQHGADRYEVEGTDPTASVGYTISLGERKLAAVDVNADAVWLARDLSALERALIAGAAASLLLVPERRD